MIKQYIKKPVIIEAIHYNGLNYDEVNEFVGKRLKQEFYDNQVTFPLLYLFIETLEGEMRISPNDYVIKGINGEFYPCKPEIFNKTYDEV